MIDEGKKDASIKVGVAGDDINAVNISNQEIIDQKNIFNINREAIQPKPTGLPNNIPRLGAEILLGREEQISYLHEQLGQPKYLSQIALCGIGGVGKTAIVRRYALSFLENYTGGVCWLYARESGLETQILDFARIYLDIHPPKESDIKAKLNFCWSRWREGNTLIIFDDVTHFEKLGDVLPPADFRFKVLITTRLQSASNKNIKFYNIHCLGKIEALSFLKTNLLEEDERIIREQNEAETLCNWVDCLPLGLELISHYLNRKQDITLSEMLQRLEHEKLSLLNSDENGGIEAVFELTWNEFNNEAKCLCYFLSLFALAPIPWWMVEQLYPDANFEELEETRDNWLLKYSLLQRLEKGIYQLHHLTREFIQAKVYHLEDEHIRKKNFCHGMTELISRLFKNETPDAANDTPALVVITHIEEVASVYDYVIDDEDLFLNHLYLQLIYCQLGIYTKAVMWGEQCYRELESRVDRKHKSLITSIAVLAGLYLQLGKIDRSEKLFSDVLSLTNLEDYEQFANYDEDHKLLVIEVLGELGKLHAVKGEIVEAEKNCELALSLQKKLDVVNNIAAIPTSVHAFCSLAEVLRVKGEYNKANKLYDTAWEFEGYEEIVEYNPFYIISHFKNASKLYLEQGRTDEAEFFADGIINVVNAGFGDNHPIYAECLSNLAEIYFAQGKHQEAEESGQRALDICQSKGITEHTSFASSLMVLGSIYTGQDRYDEAQLYYDQALKIWEKIFGIEHEQVAQTLISLAINNIGQNELKVANILLQRGQDICKTALGTSHPRYAETLFRLAQVQAYQQQYDTAEKYLEESIDILDSAFGENHPRVTEKLAILGFFSLGQGNYEAAKPLFQKLLKSARQVFGSDDPNICAYMFFMAELHFASGEVSQGKRLYDESIKIYKKERDEKISPDFSEKLMLLVDLYKSNGRFKDVEDLYRRLLETSQELLGANHPTVVQTLTRLAKFYADERSYEEAVSLYTESLEIRKNIFREQHPSIATNMINLAYVYHSLKRFEEAQELYDQALKIRIHEYGESHYKVGFVQKALASLKLSWDRDSGKIKSMTMKIPKLSSKAPEETHDKANEKDLSQHDQLSESEDQITDSNISNTFSMDGSDSDPSIEKVSQTNTEDEQQEINQARLSSDNSDTIYDGKIEKIDSLEEEVKILNKSKQNLVGQLDKLEEQKKSLADELTTLETQKQTLELELNEQKRLLESSKASFESQSQLQQSEIVELSKTLICLTNSSLELLTEPIRVVTADLEEQYQNYLKEWEKLQKAIQKFNAYSEEVDKIIVHLNNHYEADETLANHLLPKNSQKIQHIIKIIEEQLSEFDKELTYARTQHERALDRKPLKF